MSSMNRAVLFALAIAAFAQTPPSPIVSPEVHADRTVTFRFRAPHAALVNLNLEGAKAVPMEKDNATGVWSFTTAALDPDIYGYTFNADGVGLMDPNNSLMKANLISNSSAVHIPGPDLPWEVSAIP